MTVWGGARQEQAGGVKKASNADCEKLNREHGAPGRIVFRPSKHDVPVVTLTTAQGTAEISLLGAQTLSYQPVGAPPVLYMPVPYDERPAGTEIHGGIPVCWPWFFTDGAPGSKSHGLARYAVWGVKESKCSERSAEITLVLASDDETRAVWPHDFRLELTAVLSTALSLTLHAENTGRRPFTVTEGFHPYFRVGECIRTEVLGVDGSDLRQSATSRRPWRGPYPMSRSGSSIFYPTRFEYQLVDHVFNRTVSINTRGNRNLIVWNPGATYRAGSPGEERWRKFVCVEPCTTKADMAYEMKPGESHDLQMTIASRPSVPVAAAGGAKPQSVRLEKMREDTLGMFIHWGLYAIPARGEWHLWKDRVPLAEYHALTNRFAPPKSFSPREWVKIAKRMGARYAVLTTRHHDGFCLFDTKTTDFNSVKAAAHRDFVREFAEACREAGIRVGFYFSIANWQYYPRQVKDFDQRTWDEQVRTTHEALRELMTNYGTVDYLWYDGCSAPGLKDAERMERMWHVRDLNAMVRSLQPNILINDRSTAPEDYSTPEQCLAAPPPGRAWESCITVNNWWGYRADDDEWKSSETLFRSLLHCVRHGGNLLVNIGPRADGSVPEGCVKALEGLGERIRECPESIYGAVRDEQTEATREGGVVTHAAGSYWFWALETNRLDGVATMERRGPRAWRVAFKENARPCACLGQRHDLDLASGTTPVLGDATDRETPPIGAVERTDEPSATAAAFTLPAGGEWLLEVGYVNADGFRDTCRRTVFGSAAGEKVTVAVPDGGRGVYARRLTPVWRPLAPKAWQIAGVFPTAAAAAYFTDASVRAVFADDLVAAAKAKKFMDVPDDNDRADKSDVRLNFIYSAKEKTQGLAFARRIVKSATVRSVYASMGCDWWGKVYVNGKEALGYGRGWKPRAFRLDLRPGDNEILVACHSGSAQHWFTFFVNDIGMQGEGTGENGR